MTKDEAISKIGKLRNQAKGTSSPSEATSARKIADEMMRKWNLTENDLATGSKVLAFEELLAELETLSRHRELPPAVADTIGMLKKNMTSKEKADALEKIVSGVRIGSLFLGKKMAVVKDVVEATLRKHEITV